MLCIVVCLAGYFLLIFLKKDLDGKDILLTFVV